jgi:hypothetical protein
MRNKVISLLEEQGFVCNSEGTNAALDLFISWSV